jgi:hypothetical protein
MLALLQGRSVCSSFSKSSNCRLSNSQLNHVLIHVHKITSDPPRLRTGEMLILKCFFSILCMLYKLLSSITTYKVRLYLFLYFNLNIEIIRIDIKNKTQIKRMEKWRYSVNALHSMPIVIPSITVTKH